MQVTIRPSASSEEAANFFWPLFESLDWNMALSDTKTFPVSAGQGIIVAVDDSTQQVVGCVICSVYDNGYGWLGPFLMRPDLTRQGIGSKVFQAALDYFKAQNVKAIGLDGVLHMEASYAKRGFVACDHGVEYSTSLSALREHQALSPRATTSAHLDPYALVDLDQACSGLRRSALWVQVAMHKTGSNFGYAIKGASALEAFLLVRPTIKGFCFGPIFAQSIHQAKELIQHALVEMDKRYPDAMVYVSVLKSHAESLGIWESLGFREGARFTRMWNPERPAFSEEKGDRQFAILDCSMG